MLFTLCVFLLSASTGWAQLKKMEPRGAKSTRGIELTGFYGWQYGGNFTSYQGEVDVKDTENFGGMIDIPVPSRPGMMAEIFYSRQNTSVALNQFPSGAKDDLFDVAIEYIQAGALYEQAYSRGRMKPFGSFTLGATRFAPKVNSYKGIALDDEWRFSITLGLGLKALMSERVGLRLQGRLLMPMNFYGTSFWFGTGGSGVGVSGGSVILQGDVIGGLFFLF
jgi:hypothetical protein